MDPLALQMFSISTYNDRDDEKLLYNSKSVRDKDFMSKTTFFKMMQWIPIVSIIATIIFAIKNNQFMKEFFFSEQIPTNIKIALVCRSLLTILAPVLFFMDIAGTALKSCYNAKMAAAAA
jgi:hypothetical protein